MGTVIRKAFVMSVERGREAEYERRHNPIPEDLQRALVEGGARNYSIFLDPQTSLLFAYVEIEDEARWNAVAETEACRKWWASMTDVMPSNSDNSPVSRELREVFHLG
jgi:L-rhamnose mutarotase